MNNKAIIEFGFLRIWRILQISEGLHPPWSAEFFVSYSVSFNNLDNILSDWAKDEPQEGLVKALNSLQINFNVRT